METLNITKDAAQIAHQNAKASGKKLLENLFGKNVFIKNIRERIQGWEDILELNNHTQESFDKWCEGLEPHEIGRREEEAIVKAYNGPHVLDFADGTVKICPVFRMPSSSGARFAYHVCLRWLTYSGVGSRQLFIGPDALENMRDAVEKFLPQYERSRTL